MSGYEYRAAAAAKRIALLERRVAELRAEMVRLERTVIEAQERSVNAKSAIITLESQLAATQGQLVSSMWDSADIEQGIRDGGYARLMEANERLVLATLAANDIAKTATHELEKLVSTSQRDPLTNTPNRALMLDRIRRAMALAQRNHSRIALLFIDFDHFKQINDTLGHAMGDAVLQLVARRLEGVVRNTDTVSRHSGDEFLVLLTEIANVADATSIAGKMLSAISEPAYIRDQVLHFSASIGIAFYPDDADDAIRLVNHADAAMYRSKKRGGDAFELHEKEVGISG